MIKVKFFFFFLLFIAVGWDRYWEQKVEIKIEVDQGEIETSFISRREAACLCSFFKEILIGEPFAYTLSGCKPMSFICCREIGSSLASFFPSNLVLIRGWKVWEKYADRFLSSRIKIWREKSPWVKGIQIIILADLDQCEKVINANKGLFEFGLGQKIDQPLSLFAHVGNASFLEDTLKKHEGLLGILLGFGKGNAWLFYNKSKPAFLPIVWEESIEKKRSRYYEKRLTFQTLSMEDLNLPVFVGDPESVETKSLKDIYLKAQMQIQRYYRRRDFLSASLTFFRKGRV